MPYSLLKVFHIIAVVLFLGNVFTGIFWMHIAMGSRNMTIIHHTIKGILKSDRLFTIPGVVFITTAGLLTSISGHLPIIRTGWILWSIVLFTASGVAFGLKIVPLQKKIRELSAQSEPLTDEKWKMLSSAHLQWELWGAFALATPIAALILMTMKIPR